MKLELTNQQIYDTVVTHLWTQNARASKNGVCKYLEPDTGNKCAVGCLIPESLYHSKLEGAGVKVLLCSISPARKAVVEYLGLADEQRLFLLTSLQTFHDSQFHSLPAPSGMLTNMLNYLSSIATNLDLSPAILDTTFRTNTPATPTTQD